MDNIKVQSNNYLSNDFVNIKPKNESKEVQALNKNNELKDINMKQINEAVEKANKVFNESTHLKFEVHEKTKDIMIKIIDDKTGEVVKEFPPEKLLDMVAKMWEVAGIFIDEKR